MISAGDFKNGFKLLNLREMFTRIVDFQHVKPGKVASFCKNENEE